MNEIEAKFAECVEALEQLQAFMTGRIPAWNFPYTRMEEYKAAMRPLARWPAIRIADVQGKIADALAWRDELPTPGDQAVLKTLVSLSRRRNSKYLGLIFAQRRLPTPYVCEGAPQQEVAQE